MCYIPVLLSIKIWLFVVAGLLAAVGVIYFIIIYPRLRHGREGESKVRKVLDAMANKATIPLHDLLIPTAGGYTAQIDHLLISQRGLFVIETKSHYGAITGDSQNREWRQVAANYSHNFYNPVMQNVSHIRHLRNLLPKLPAEWFISVVVFTDADSLKISGQQDGTVVLLPQLVEELKHYPHIIERRQLDNIARTVRKANIRNPLTRLKHIFHAQHSARQSKKNK